MNEFWKWFGGFAAGAALKWASEIWTERRTLRSSVRDAYLTAVAKPGVDADPYLRFAALQKSGAWRLRQRELVDLAQEVCGRGWKHPYEAWQDAFPAMRAFPRDFLRWAKDDGIDLADSQHALERIAAVYDAASLPRPPGAGTGWV